MASSPSQDQHRQLLLSDLALAANSEQQLARRLFVPVPSVSIAISGCRHARTSAGNGRVDADSHSWNRGDANRLDPHRVVSCTGDSSYRWLPPPAAGRKPVPLLAIGFVAIMRTRYGTVVNVAVEICPIRI